MSLAVVIPAYNAESFLAETIETVLAQTLRPDEILVIDDGSSDATASIAESFAPAVKVFRRPNSRQGASRNFGVAQATSEWIAFLDADDLWTPDKLERQMHQLALEPEADVCCTGRLRFMKSGDTVTYRPVILAPPPADILDALRQRCTFLPSSVVIRRSAFLVAGGFATTFKIAEDWDLWLRLLNSGTQFTSCPEPLLLYRLHPQSASTDGIVLLQENTEIHSRLVMPHLRGVARFRARNRFLGENEAAAAYALRQRRDARCLPLMAQSLLHLPFEDPYRYKVLAHMLYTHLRGGFHRAEGALHPTKR